jgi:translation initiation factor IF-3
LVEVTPNAKPPVCKVMNYGKFRFEKTRKLNKQKRNKSNSR